MELTSTPLTPAGHSLIHHGAHQVQRVENERVDVLLGAAVAPPVVCMRPLGGGAASGRRCAAGADDAAGRDAPVDRPAGRMPDVDDDHRAGRGRRRRRRRRHVDGLLSANTRPHRAVMTPPRASAPTLARGQPTLR